MTPQEHEQIAAVNAQWRSMTSSKNDEKAKAGLADTGKGKPKDIERAFNEWWDSEPNAHWDHPESFAREAWKAAVAYLSEPGALRFLANESITKENDALKKDKQRLSELSEELLTKVGQLNAKVAELEAKMGRLYAWLFRINPKCDDLHHKPGEYHTGLEACPILEKLKAEMEAK